MYDIFFISFSEEEKAKVAGTGSKHQKLLVKKKNRVQTLKMELKLGPRQKIVGVVARKGDQRALVKPLRVNPM